MQVWVCVQIDDDGDLSLEFLATSLDRIKAEVADYVGLNMESHKDNVSLEWEETSKFDSEEYYVGTHINREYRYGSEFHVYQQYVLD